MPKYSITHCNYLVAELLTQPLSIGPMIRRPELCVARIWCLVRGKHCLSIAISETFDFICFRLSSYAVAMLSQFCVWGCWKRSKVCYQGNDLPVPWGSRCVWGRADWTFVSHLVHRNTNLGPKVQTSLSAWSSTTALASISSWSLIDLQGPRVRFAAQDLFTRSRRTEGYGVERKLLFHQWAIGAHLTEVALLLRRLCAAWKQERDPLRALKSWPPKKGMFAWYHHTMHSA